MRFIAFYKSKHLAGLVLPGVQCTGDSEQSAQTVGAWEGMTLGHHLAAGGYHGTDWGLCTLTLGFFWSTMRETWCDRVRGNGRRGIGPTDRPFWQRLALLEQMEREREAHRCDIDPMGLVLPVLICERKMNMFELLMKAMSCPRLLAHYQKKRSEYYASKYINTLFCVSQAQTAHCTSAELVGHTVAHKSHPFLIWQALIWLADYKQPLVICDPSCGAPYDNVEITTHTCITNCTHTLWIALKKLVF